MASLASKIAHFRWGIALGSEHESRFLQDIATLSHRGDVRPHHVIPLSLSYRCHACSNIKPVRVVLDEKAETHRSGIFSLFPYLPWGTSSKVAVENRLSLSRASSYASTASFKLDPELERILNFPPLFEAFGDFCQRALCSEVSAYSTWRCFGFDASARSRDRILYPGVECRLTNNILPTSSRWYTSIHELHAGT